MTYQLELTTIKRQWLDEATATLKPLLPKLGRFTTDDLHDRIPKPYHVNFYGVLMAKLKNQGLILRVNAVASKRPEANGRLVSVWEAV